MPSIDISGIIEGRPVGFSKGLIVAWKAEPIRKKYDEAGITIFEDQRVLEAMEGGNPVA